MISKFGSLSVFALINGVMVGVMIGLELEILAAEGWFHKRLTVNI